MKTKNISILIACVMLAAFVFGATGVMPLADASVNEAASSDKLVGVLITREYLNLFDSGQFIEDNINKLANGGEISASDSAEYQGKLYAALVGTQHTKEYVFEGINGICYFVAQVTDESGVCWRAVGNDAITDGNINVHSTDEGEGISLEGTVYVSTGGKTDGFYFNPVYQTPAGEIYAVSGSGIFGAGDANAAGASMSHEIKENQSSTVGGRTVSFGTEVKVTICYMDEPVKVSILQFGEENQLLSQEDYSPDSLPDMLQVQPGTQYIIVETASVSQEQALQITREIYQPEDKTLWAFSGRDDGICVKKWCEINWNN